MISGGKHLRVTILTSDRCSNSITWRSNKKKKRLNSLFNFFDVKWVFERSHELTDTYFGLLDAERLDLQDHMAS